MGPAGQYLLCGYLYGGGTTHATGSAEFSLRTPHDSITVAPIFHAVAGHKFDIPLHYYVEPGTTATIFLRFYPKFRVNGTLFSCSNPLEVLEGNPGPGQGNFRFPVAVDTAGAYGMCGTIYVGFGQVVVAAASATVVATNGSSGGSECVVPNIVGKQLASARTMLARGHCKLGRVAHHKRHGHKRGTVVSQSAKAGQRLPAGARINVVVAK
jgi:hypothetical protein